MFHSSFDLFSFQSNVVAEVSLAPPRANDHFLVCFDSAGLSIRVLDFCSVARTQRRPGAVAVMQEYKDVRIGCRGLLNPATRTSKERD